jgi:proline iminopeptidase
MPATLFPDPPLLRAHALAVGEGHVLDVREYGSAHGTPALVLHGGPGSGCSPLLRRFFHPGRFRIVCIDQRGAGWSQPAGGTEHNTTAHLLADLRRVREHLDIARWLVVGGSWGATLALAHAADAPRAIAGLVLRSSFLARREDIDWFFQGARSEQPEAWQTFAAAAPAGEQEALLPWLARTLSVGAAEQQRGAALAWWRWEQALGGASSQPEPQAAVVAGLIQRYRVQSHYLLNHCFLDERPLLTRCALVPTVPTLLLHGTLDRVCRAEGATLLQQALPHARLLWVAGAGHDPTHPAMAAAMVQGIEDIGR